MGSTINAAESESKYLLFSGGKKNIKKYFLPNFNSNKYMFLKMLQVNIIFV